MSVTHTPLSKAEILAVAVRIAGERHAGQLDAAGAPYMGHLNRVVARAEHLRAQLAPHQRPEIVQAVAWLHDVIEDTPVSAEDLLQAGLPTEVVDEVVRLTHTRNQPREQYLNQVLVSVVASVVKLADTLDNADPVRLAAVRVADPQRADRLERKYGKALELLQQRLGVPPVASLA